MERRERHGRRSRFAGILLVALSAALTGRADGQTSPHGGLTIPCEQCHTTASWKISGPTPGFSHRTTTFPLAGQHSILQCRQCHTSLVFAPLSMQCADCHADVHRGELGTLCERCHTPQSWLVPDMPQRHAAAGFSLEGPHLAAECKTCHSSQQKYEFVNMRTDCFSCHDAQYRATTAPAHAAVGYGTACEQCHDMRSFQWTGSFDHAATGFPLTGAHLGQACVACHRSGQFKAISAECVSCHRNDYDRATNPNHASGSFPLECAGCHSTSLWHPANFDHQATAFPLTGAHLRQPCAGCHTTAQYKDAPTDCYGCHRQDFERVQNPNHVASGFSTDCVGCHSTNGWEPSSFNHQGTAFPLTGSHVSAQCSACHVNGQFKGTATECVSCHRPAYNQSANPNHIAAGFPVDCVTCHSTTGWQPANYNHSTSGFPLTGAHVQTACISCHVNSVYNGTPMECIGCHKTAYDQTTNPNHLAAGFPVDCASCHTTTAWQPATFDHTQYFPISAGSKHSPGRWNACTDCHTVPTNYAQFSCLNCHEHAQTAMDQKHIQVQGYRYNSPDCLRCHPGGG